MVGNPRAQLRGIDVVQLAEGIEILNIAQRFLISSKRTHNVERMAVVADKAKQGIRLADGHFLVFADGGQVAQIFQREQRQLVEPFRLQLTVMLLPFCGKAHLLTRVARCVDVVVGPIPELGDKLFEFHTCVPRNISFSVDNSNLHNSVGFYNLQRYNKFG